MAQISSEEERLLLKLYNLRGDESTILMDIRNEKSNIEQMIDEAKASKERTESDRVEFEKELSDFISQKDRFFEMFDGLDDSYFEALQAVGVTVPIESLLSSLGEKAPDYEDSLRAKIDEADKKNTELFGEISMLGAKLETTEENLRRAEADRESLNSLIEQSLSGNESDSLSKQYIRSILSNFACFSEEEITELCKVILFPEDALVEFDRTYDERKNAATTPIVEEPTVAFETVEENPTVEVEAPAVETAEEEEKEEEDTKEISEEPAVPVEVPEDDDISEIVAAAFAPTEEEYEDQPVFPTVEETYADEKPVEEAEVEAPVEEEEPSFDDAPTTIIDLAAISDALTEDEKRMTKEEEPKKDDLEETLESLGLDSSKFPSEGKEEILAHLSEVDKNVIKNNFELLRSINADDEVYKYVEGHMFLTDTELSDKITFLRGKKISEKKIKELLESTLNGLRNPLSVIKERTTSIEEVYGEINDTNVDYLHRDAVTLAKNIAIVRRTFELDEKEERNFRGVLFSPYLENDMKILKEYLISVVKQDNGRYALNAFANRPIDLLVGIDTLIEQGLEGLVTSTPEVLGQNLDMVVRRAVALREKGLPLYDEENETYRSEIVDYKEFEQEYGKAPLPELRSAAEANSKLATIVGNEDFTQILVDALNEYYSDPVLSPEVTVEGEAKEKYEELLAAFESSLKATKAGNLTYEVGDVSISRNKLERNIKLLLNILSRQGQSIDGVEKEIMLISALHNLRAEDETLRKVVDTCLGFNEENTVGGPSL